MENQIKICQNCKANFEIASEDFEFYNKIFVPPPTFCPDCRMKRRMVWRNERSLYKRKCNATGHNEEVVSMYSPEIEMNIYDQKAWESDIWDPTDYKRDYDFNKTFLAQFHELSKEVPFPNLNGGSNVNCHYSNWAHNSKDCYLVFGGSGQENINYANQTVESKDSMDLYTVGKLELSYDDTFCQNSFRLLFSQNCDNCLNSYFLYDCKNCQDCFGCAGLRNKQYYIFNEPYSKEEYENKIKEFDLGSFKSLSEEKEKSNNIKIKIPHKFANLLKAINSTGDNVIDAQNCKNVFDIVAGGTENSKYSFRIGKNSKDMYDCSAYLNCELQYENFSVGVGTYKILFSVFVWTGHDIQYSLNCHNCNNLFGCIGLRNKQYCILNKQYTKESFDELRTKIIEHMNSTPYIDKKGRIYKYGEFFPSELSPFSYNETIAQEYFPLTKEQAIEQGYSWKEPEIRSIQPTVNSGQLPDNIKDVNDDILKQVIGCEHNGTCNEQCTTAFKIIPQELEFYRKMNLPLPRLCPNCRHYQRIKQRNPLKLWKRKCMCQGQIANGKEQNVYTNTITHTHGTELCQNEFETTYSPDRPEIVYCEQCYQSEVV